MNVNVKPAIHYASTGTQTQFTIPFDYLRKAFVKVTVNGEPVTDYTILGSELTFKEAPAVGADIYIYRDTATTRLVSWKDASVLHAKDMTIQQVQELHILEEEDFKFNGVLEGAEAARDEAISAVRGAEEAAKTAQNASNVAQAWAEEEANTIPSLIGSAKSSKQWADKANKSAEQADNTLAAILAHDTPEYLIQVKDLLERLVDEFTDGTFQIDTQGNLMPKENPVESINWDIDNNGDIMPAKGVVL